MQQIRNSIDRTVFAFEYEEKVVAARCNSLIASIFNTQIVPEMDAVLSRKMLHDFPIELDALELYIGSINERDLRSELSKRINNALEKAIGSKLSTHFLGSNKQLNLSTNDFNDYLIAALEIYLVRGYMPSWFGKKATIDKLLSNLMVQKRGALIDVLKKHKANTSVMSRLSNSVDAKVFDALLFEINPLQYDWIMDFRKDLFSIEIQGLPSWVGRKELLNITNSYMLGALLNIESNSFHKLNFVHTVLSLFEAAFSIDLISLKGSLNLPLENSEFKTVLETAIPKKNSPNTALRVEDIEVTLKQVIEYYKHANSTKRNKAMSWKRERLVAIIKNTKTRTQLIAGLNDHALFNILEQFYFKETSKLINFLTEFAKVLERTNNDRSIKQFSTVQELMLSSILHKDHNSSKQLNYNSLFLFLISLLELDKKTLVRNPAIAQFLITQKQLDGDEVNKMLQANGIIQKASKTTKARAAVKTAGDLKRKRFSRSKASYDERNVYRKKIIRHYLELGYLPIDFSELNQKDVQLLFTELLSHKDPILAEMFKKEHNSDAFYHRIEYVLNAENQAILTDYIGFYFSEAVQYFSDILSEIEAEFSSELVNELAREFKNELLIRVLLAGKGVIRKELFVVLISNKLASKLTQKENALDQLAHFVQKRVYARTPKSQEHQNNALSPEIQTFIFGEIESVLHSFLRRFSHSRFEDSAMRSNEMIQVQKLGNLAQLYPEVFQAVIAHSHFDFEHVLIVLRLEVSETSWKHIELALSLNPDIKIDLSTFNDEAEAVYESVQRGSFNIVDAFKKIKKDTTFRTKIILSLALKEEKYLRQLYKAFKNEEIDFNLAKSHSSIHSYIKDLMKFKPTSLPPAFRLEIWPKLMFSFVFHLKINSLKAAKYSFASVFYQHIYKELKAMNKEQFFSGLCLELSMAKKNSLTELFGLENVDMSGLWAIENPGNTASLSSDSLEERAMGNTILFDQIESLSVDNQAKKMKLIFQNRTILEDYVRFLGSRSIPKYILPRAGQSQKQLAKMFNYSSILLAEESKKIQWKVLVLKFAIYLKFNQNGASMEALNEDLILFANQDEYNGYEGLVLEVIDEIRNSENTNFNNSAGLIELDKEHKRKSIWQKGNDNSSTNKKSYFRKSSVKRRLEALSFFAYKEFLPWWTATDSINILLQSILLDSQTLGKLFEEAFLEAELRRAFVGPLILALPPDQLAVIKLIAAKHDRVNRLWIQALTSSKSNTKEDHYPRVKEPLNWVSSSSEHTEVSLDQSEHLKKPHLRKELYTLEENEILEQCFQADHQRKEQLSFYLELAPEMYFKDLNPAKWRILVYEFALDYYNSKSTASIRDFNSSFLKYLIKQHTSIPWKKIFKSLYKNIQKAGMEEKYKFPKELLLLMEMHTSNENESDSPLEHRNEEQNMEVLDEGIQIYNSGLILIWPFFTRFFEQLGLLENGQFINAQSRNRAVYLLQYLGFNSIDFPEYELVLNKYFVGMPIKDHLNQLEDLTNSEKELCTSLMKGLIKNWEKVKDSSIAAIQETFIQREGILIIGEKDIKLKVEKKGVDVLLESLQWNISVIKLPWMQRTVFVEWM